MTNFTYYTPTKVVFGRNTEEETGRLISQAGGRKVLLHYGSGSAERSGLLNRICASLEEAGLDYVCLGGVVPNPRLSKVYEGIELCRREEVDFILAVGGGSVIDSAKAIGYGAVHECDVWNLYEKKEMPRGCLPIGAVLTIAASGSEMSNSSVITNEKGWLKRSVKSDYARCRFAVMNPELTCSLPAFQTASGSADILMHTMERYFTPECQLALTDGIAEALMRTVLTNARIALADPGNYEARAELMWAGSLSHNGLTGCGGGAGDWAPHQLEHELGGMFDVAHGAGLTAVWGSWARYVYRENPKRFAQFAVRVLQIPETAGNAEELALKGIEALEKYFVFLGLPVTIRGLGIDLTTEQIRELAYKCSFFGTRTIGGFKKLDREDMEAIYTMAR